MNRGFPYNYGTWMKDEYIERSKRPMFMNIILVLNSLVIVLMISLLLGMILSG